jgi:hypothetical protein
MTRKNIGEHQKTKKSSDGSDKIYTLDVFIIGGPVVKEFEGKEISRTIQIKGNNTLEDLHHIIFKAFDRWEEHLYEFNLGKGPYDRSVLYSLPIEDRDQRDDKRMGDVTKTTIEALGLTVDRAFGYWFDFGDDWHHQINVAAIGKCPKRGKYPKIIKRVGKSPPQYSDFKMRGINDQ